jgi:hypothetical protein
MEHFIAYRLKFTCEAETAVSLPRYSGSTIRGAFFGALRQDFCLNKNLNSCLHCLAAEVCPICRLVATVERDNNRGAEIPRPFALEPVITGKTVFEPGQSFSFGITLFGQSLSLFPYAILAIQRMGETGMGNRTNAPGRFLLREAKVVNPLIATEKSIYSSDTRMVSVPDLAITQQDVMNYAGRLSPDTLHINLLTPLRLVAEGSLVQKLTFRIFTQRLLRRLTDLYRYCFNQELDLDFPGLLKQAEEVQVIQDNTCWVDLSSYSYRRRASTPTGGLIGEITIAGNLKGLLPLIVWGELTHIGKDATRGNGWYQITDNSS